MQGFGTLVSQFKYEQAIEQIRSIWHQSLEASERYSKQELEEMKKVYSEAISPASSFLTETGEFVVVSATIDPLIEKYEEEKDEEKRPLYQVYEIANAVEGSSTTIKFIVFHCANEDEKNKISRCMNKRKCIFETNYQ